MENKIKIFTLLVLSCPFVLVFLSWDILPDQIIVYHSMHGEDIFQSKTWIILIALCFTLLPYTILTLSEKAFKKSNKLDGYFHPIHPKIRLLVFSFLSFYACLMVLRSADLISLFLDFPSFMLGASMCFLGGIFPLLPQNGLIGVRTKWTLADKTVWEKTHHFSRWIFLVSGSAMMVLSWIYPDEKRILFYLSALLLVASIAILYSYLTYRKRGSHEADKV